MSDLREDVLGCAKNYAREYARWQHNQANTSNEDVASAWLLLETQLDAYKRWNCQHTRWTANLSAYVEGLDPIQPLCLDCNISWNERRVVG